jgi:DNA mismatch repair protein PMS1
MIKSFCLQENFGLNVIEVKDNGSGIKKEDTANMARPHFTSKLASFDDLQSLDLYGFRGEALASIAAVSDLSITTRIQTDPIATTYTLDHSGNITSTKHSHLGQGTTATVANIFKNLPVRKQCFKSAKKCKEELKRVEDLLIGFGLAHCGLRLTLKHNKCIIWQKIQTSDFGSNVSLILGAALFQQLVPMNYQSFSPMVKIRSFVPKYEADPSMVSRSTSDKMYLLVNQRCVIVKPLIQVGTIIHHSCQPCEK